MNWKIIMWICFGMAIFIVGIVVGMLWGTYAVIDHVAYGLSGSTFIVNLNETKIVDYTYQKFNETILPILRGKNET